MLSSWLARATSCCCPFTSNTSAPGKSHQSLTETGPYCSDCVASEGNIESPFVSYQGKILLEIEVGNLNKVAASWEWIRNYPGTIGRRLTACQNLESLAT